MYGHVMIQLVLGQNYRRRERHEAYGGHRVVDDHPRASTLGRIDRDWLLPFIASM